MTPRQAQILKSIVETYAHTAAPVGSLSLAELLDVSPATIRAEMASLETQGYIRQPHTSAGRIPTDKGYRTYVNGLEESISRQAYAIERQIEDSGGPEQAIKNAAQSLATATGNLGLATWSDNIFRFGLSNLFSQPEFRSGDQVQEIARLLDYLPEYLAEIFPNANRISILIGSENSIGKSAGVSSVISRVRTPYGQSFIGVMGPTRQDYGQVVGLVRYVSEKLERSINA